MDQSAGQYEKAAHQHQTAVPASDDGAVFRAFNSVNSKRFCVCVVTVVSVYHLIVLKGYYGEDSCVGLFEDGRYQGKHIWQPYGCMLHYYSASEARQCVKYNQYIGNDNWIVFIGDSRLRQIYYAIISHFAADTSVNLHQNGTAHEDRVFHDSDLSLKVDFYWKPFVGENVSSILEGYATRNQTPSLIVLTSGTWFIKESRGRKEGLQLYTENLSILSSYIKPLVDRNTNILWMPQGDVIPNKLNANRSAISNRLIKEYNEVARKALAGSGIRMWTSSQYVANGYNSDSQDGLHYGRVAVDYILVNSYCNELMDYPDGTCCSRTPPLAPIQSLVLAIFSLSAALWLIILVGRFVFWTSMKKVYETKFMYNLVTSSFKESKDSSSSQTHTLESWCHIALLMLYVFVCDRSSLFMKENKWFTYFNFFLPVCYLGVLGMFFNEDKQATQFMHREQTNEWKGWMQLLLLIYHITGASKVLWIFVSMRCVVAAYLFLSGYGHFCYFFTTGDYSLKRVLKVLFRYNFLVFLLTMTMDRPYQFYYFVPLVSFSFLVLYIVMALPPQTTASSCEVLAWLWSIQFLVVGWQNFLANTLYYFYLFAKLALSFAGVSVLYMSEVLFEWVFMLRPWRHLFEYPAGGVQSWWYRWRLDRYSVVCGATFGALTYLGRQFGIVNDTHSYLFSKRWTFFACLLALLSLLMYSLVVFRCGSKSNCLELHSYISFIPVVSYLLLRNALGSLRSRVSVFFAWFGKISLETGGCLLLIPLAVTKQFYVNKIWNLRAKDSFKPPGVQCSSLELKRCSNCRKDCHGYTKATRSAVEMICQCCLDKELRKLFGTLLESFSDGTLKALVAILSDNGTDIGRCIHINKATVHPTVIRWNGTFFRNYEFLLKVLRWPFLDGSSIMQLQSLGLCKISCHESEVCFNPYHYAVRIPEIVSVDDKLSKNVPVASGQETHENSCSEGSSDACGHGCFSDTTGTCTVSDEHQFGPWTGQQCQSGGCKSWCRVAYWEGNCRVGAPGVFHTDFVFVLSRKMGAAISVPVPRKVDTNAQLPHNHYCSCAKYGLIRTMC